MRNWLKTERDEGLFRFFEAELKLLKELDEQDEIDLVFMDEVGFSLHPTVPYAWQPIGKRIGLPAQRGKNLTVMGCFQLDHTFEAYLFEGPMNAEAVKASIEHFVTTINKKTIMILDQASIHTSNLIKEQIPKWRQKGLYLQFLPAYSPELNLIEILWKNIKHHWLPQQAYKSLEELKQYLFDIFRNLRKEYRINFC